MKQLFTFLLVMFTLLGQSQNSITVGTGTAFNSPFLFPTPYGTYFSNLRVQYLLRSDELLSLGLVAGDITAIALNVYNINNCIPMPDYTIQMKSTNVSSLTAVFDNSGFTTVYNTPSFMPENGWNTHAFTNPFYWDGQSNLLLDLCMAMIQGGNSQNASVYYTVTPGVNTAAFYRHSQLPACGTYQPAILSDRRANMKIYGALANCLPPLNLAATFISSHTAVLNWTAQGAEANWDLKYGPSGFNPNNSGTLIQGLSAAECTITGLESTTTYDAYVKAVCSITETSYWSPVATFTTLCQSEELPHMETFSLSTWPGCWYQTFDGTIPSSRWVVSNTALAGGAPYEMKASWVAGTGTARLVSPPLDLSGFGEVALSFRHFYDDWSPGTTLKIQTSADGVTWLDENFSFESGYGNIGPEIIYINLSNFSAHTQIAWAMQGNLNGIDFWYIDDVIISGTPQVMAGDANCDSAVNLLDIITIAGEIMGSNPEPFCFLNADVTGDGIINLLDVIGVANIIMGQ